jgi:hypothetical protein
LRVDFPLHGRGRGFESLIAHQQIRPSTCGNGWRVFLCSAEDGHDASLLSIDDLHLLAD